MHKPKRAGWALGAWAFYATQFSSIFGLLFSIAGTLWSRRATDSSDTAPDSMIGNFSDTALDSMIDNFSDTVPDSMIGSFSDTVPDSMVRSFSDPLHLYVNIYAFCVSSVLLMTHFCFPIAKRSGGRPGILLRCFVMAGLSIPLHISDFTRFLAWCYTVIAIIYAFSAIRNERGGIRQEGASGWPRMSVFKPSWLTKNHKGAVWSRIFVFIIWLMVQAGLFYYKYTWAKDIVALIVQDVGNGAEVWPCYTDGDMSFKFDQCAKIVDLYELWFPIAKGNGLCLDFNCALILLLITQSVIRCLHEWSESRGFMYYAFGWMPIHKTVQSHKQLAIVIFLQSCGHSFSHMMCLSYTLPVWKRGLWNQMSTWEGKAVTLSIWGTGYVLLFTLVFMFAASMGNFRRMMFKTFTFSHRLFAGIWMICLFWHSTVFWMFGLLPCIIYVANRINRSYSAKNTQSRLMEVTYTPPVIALVFTSPIAYNVGQYVFLKCPWVSKYQSHPFTISSTPESGILSLHIKVHPGGWTEDMQKFVTMVVKDCESRGEGIRGVSSVPDGFSFQFGYLNDIDNRFVRGKMTWKERQLFRIDGPHSAPAVHFHEYETIIVASCGIGLTPLHSIMRCLTEFAWQLRSDATSVKTRHLYAVWLCRHDCINAYRWFMESCSQMELFMQTLPDEAASRVHFELHLFVTSYRKNGSENFEVTVPDPACMEFTNPKVIRPYTSDQLYQTTNNPKIDSSMFDSVMNQAKETRTNCMGCTHVWNGRANWEGIFKRVKARHHSGAGCQRHQVGVFFCGVPAVASDMQSYSMKHSDSTCVFKVMKESF